ncbi:MAG: NAD(P)H-hydrate dehydratase [Firmicutes bacterium]|nr:NAD(P)H-hydrate dehydratase [Bacillota bacterium]
MKVANSAEMRQLDQLASSQYRIPSLVLMENAGLRVVEVVNQLLGFVAGKKVVVLAGKGNNGGDGFVVARHLINHGADIKVFLLAQPEEISGDARINLDILGQMGARLYPVLSDKDLNVVKIALVYADLVVDAMYGTGFKGAVTAQQAKLIRLVNQSGKPIVAVDIPSGIEADTGKVHGECIRATRTVTFCLPKIGLLIEPGASYVGELTVADISIPQQLVNAQKIHRYLITRDWCASQLPRRSVEGHKGSYGHVLIIGGAEGMTGAITLASEAALRAGAGLVTAAIPASLNPILEVKLTEVMTKPLPETPLKTISLEALPVIEEFLPRASVVAIGPGMSRHPDLFPLIRTLLPKLQVPLIIDADGLNALADDPTVLKDSPVPIVLTPHPGEMARLLKTTVDKVQDNRLAVVEQAAQDWQATVVLKGAKTLVASPRGECFINLTGNPGMATGGTGDVLTGIIAGLIAQGINPTSAAALGVYLHGAAGDLAAQTRGQRGLVAGDLITELPAVLKQFEA